MAQLCLSWALPNQAQVAANCRPVCSSCQVTQEGHRWWLTLHLWEASEPMHLVDSFKTGWVIIQPPHTTAHSRSGLSGHQSPIEASPVSWGRSLNSSFSAVVLARPHNESARESVPPNYVSIAIKTQLQQYSSHSSHRGHTWRAQFG